MKPEVTLPPESETRVAALADETHREPQAAELVGRALECEERHEAMVAVLRAAIDKGDASGTAANGTLARVRGRAGLPARSRLAGVGG